MAHGPALRLQRAAATRARSKMGPCRRPSRRTLQAAVINGKGGFEVWSKEPDVTQGEDYESEPTTDDDDEVPE